MISMSDKAKNQIAEHLVKHRLEITYELRSAKYRMRNLVEKQTLLKRKRAELDKVIRGLRKAVTV